MIRLFAALFFSLALSLLVLGVSRGDSGDLCSDSGRDAERQGLCYGQVIAESAPAGYWRLGDSLAGDPGRSLRNISPEVVSTNRETSPAGGSGSWQFLGDSSLANDLLGQSALDDPSFALWVKPEREGVLLALRGSNTLEVALADGAWRVRAGQGQTIEQCQGGEVELGAWGFLTWSAGVLRWNGAEMLRCAKVKDTRTFSLGSAFRENSFSGLLAQLVLWNRSQSPGVLSEIERIGRGGKTLDLSSGQTPSDASSGGLDQPQSRGALLVQNRAPVCDVFRETSSWWGRCQLESSASGKVNSLLYRIDNKPWRQALGQKREKRTNLFPSPRGKNSAGIDPRGVRVESVQIPARYLPLPDRSGTTSAFALRGSGVVRLGARLRLGKGYTCSLWVRNLSGGSALLRAWGKSKKISSSRDWQRVALSGTYMSPRDGCALRSAGKFLLSNILLERSSGVHSFFDGNFSLARWLGRPDASPSVLPQSRVSGRTDRFRVAADTRVQSAVVARGKKRGIATRLLSLPQPAEPLADPLPSPLLPTTDFSRSTQGVPSVVVFDRTTPANSPTDATQLVYNIEFSEAVEGFSAGAVAVGGTASGISWNKSLTGEGDSYTLTLDRVTAGATPVGVWGEAGSDPGQFSSPLALASDSSGNIYVADAGNERIQKFNASTGALDTSFADAGVLGGVYPTGIALSGNALYVANGGDVQKFNASTGALDTSFADEGTLGGVSPSSIALSGNALYVANGADVQKFNASTGALETSFADEGTLGGFSFTAGIAADSSGNIYVSDQSEMNVRKFNSEGVLDTSFADAGVLGSLGSGEGEFFVPYGIALDGSGNIYVADAYNDRVQKFSSEGAYLSQFGTWGTALGQMIAPAGITLAGGDIFVAEAFGNRVQIFDPTSATPAGGTVVPVVKAGSVYDLSYENSGPEEDAPGEETVLSFAGGAPSASWSATPTSPNKDTTVSYTLTFSEDVTGVAAADFSNQGTAENCEFSPGTDSGSTRTVSISGCGEGTLRPRFAAEGALNASSVAGPLAPVDGAEIVLDRTAPSALSLEQAPGQGDPTSRAPINFAFDANEALDPATVAAADFSPANASLSVAPRANRITNPSIESSASGFFVDSSGGDPPEPKATLARSSAQAKFGSYSLQATATSASGTFTLFPGDPDSLSSAFSVTAGRDYAYSGYIRAAQAGGAAELAVIYYGDSSGEAIDIKLFTAESLAANTWQRVSGVHRAPPGAAFALMIYVIEGQSQSSGDTYFFDGFMTEEARAVRNYFDGTGAVNSSGDYVVGGTVWDGSANLSSSQNLMSYNIFATPSANPASVTVEPASTFAVADLAGNVFDNEAAITGSDRTVSYDSSAPLITLEKASGQASYTTSSSVQYTLSVAGNKTLNRSTITSSDFTVSGGSLTSISPGIGTDQASYTITVTASGAENLVSIAPSGSFEIADTDENVADSAAGTDRTVVYDSSTPSTPTFSFSGASSHTYAAGNTIYIRPGSGRTGEVTLEASSADSGSGIKSIQLPTPTGFALKSGSANTGSNSAPSSVGPYPSPYPHSATFTWSGSPSSSSTTATATNGTDLTSTAAYDVVPDTAPPTGGALTVNSVAAATSETSSNNNTGTISISRTDYSADAASGLASSVLTREAGTLSGNTCSYTNSTTTTVTTSSQAVSNGCYRYTLTGTDRVGNTESLLTVVRVDSSAPSGGSFNNSVPAYLAASSFTLSVTNFSDSDSGVTNSLQRRSGTLSADNCSSYGSWGSASAGLQSGLTTGCYEYRLRGTNGTGLVEEITATVRVDTSPPSGGSITAPVNNSTNTSGSFTLSKTDYSDANSSMATNEIQMSSATLSAGSCGTYSSWSAVSAGTQNVASGCYKYRLVGTNKAGTSATSSESLIRVDTTPPTAPALELDAGGDSFVSGSTVYVNPQSDKSGAFRVKATTSDPETGITSVTFPNTSGYTRASYPSSIQALVGSYSPRAVWSLGGSDGLDNMLEVATTTNLSAVGGPTIGGATGPLSSGDTGATTFDGIDDRVSTSVSPNRVGASSYMLWARPTSLASTRTLISGWLADAPTLYLDTGGDLRFRPQGNSATNEITWDTNLSTNTWRHIGLVLDRENATASLYLDGDLVSSQALGAYSSTILGTMFGARASTSTVDFYAGQMAWLGYMDGAASASEFALAYSAFSRTSTLAQTSSPYEMPYSWSGVSASTGTQTVTATNTFSATSQATYSIQSDTTEPTGGALTVNGQAATSGGSTSTSADGQWDISVRTAWSDSGVGMRSNLLLLERATWSAGSCGSVWTRIAYISGTPNQDRDSGYCYRYTLLGTDRVGNESSVSTTVRVDASQLYSWGTNINSSSANSLGRSSSFSAAPGRVSGSNDIYWTSPAVGNNFSLAVADFSASVADRLQGWGSDASKQLDGLGSTSAPVAVGGANTWNAVAAGTDFAVASRTSSPAGLYIWGSNEYYRTGNGLNSGTSTMGGTATASGTWTDVSAGFNHGLAIKGGELFSWGANAFGKPGQGVTNDTFTTTPTKVGSLTTWTKVSAGYRHSLGIAEGGKLYAWGDDSSGEVGNGATTGSILAPTNIDGNSTGWTDIATGGSRTFVSGTTTMPAHSLGIKGGKLYAWGSDAKEQLGNGASGSTTSPQQITVIDGGQNVANDTDWTAVSAGDGYSYAIKGGRLYGWGTPLVDYPDVKINTPVPLSSATDWRELSEGSSSVHFLAAKGYTAVPSVVSFDPATEATKTTGSKTWNLVLSNSVSDLVQNDFTLSAPTGWSISSLSGSGAQYTLTVTCNSSCSEGAIIPSLKANSVSVEGVTGPSQATEGGAMIYDITPPQIYGINSGTPVAGPSSPQAGVVTLNNINLLDARGSANRSSGPKTLRIQYRVYNSGGSWTNLPGECAEQTISGGGLAGDTPVSAGKSYQIGRRPFFSSTPAYEEVLSPCWFQSTNLADGLYELRILAADAAGNENTQTLSTGSATGALRIRNTGSIALANYTGAEGKPATALSGSSKTAISASNQKMADILTGAKWQLRVCGNSPTSGATVLTGAAFVDIRSIGQNSVTGGAQTIASSCDSSSAINPLGTAPADDAVSVNGVIGLNIDWGSLAGTYTLPLEYQLGNELLTEPSGG